MQVFNYSPDDVLPPPRKQPPGPFEEPLIQAIPNAQAMTDLKEALGDFAMPRSTD